MFTSYPRRSQRLKSFNAQQKLSDFAIAAVFILFQLSNANAQQSTFDPHPTFAPEFELQDDANVAHATADHVIPEISRVLNSTQVTQTIFKNWLKSRPSENKRLRMAALKSRFEAIQTVKRNWPISSSEGHKVNTHDPVLNAPDFATYLSIPSTDRSVEVKFTTDPFVIEVKMGMLSLEELEKLGPRAQKFIFDQLQVTGFTPRLRASTGHFNIDGKSAFGEDEIEGLRRALNFMVDFVNHDFAMGTFLYDPSSAQSLREVNSDYKIFLEKIEEIKKRITMGRAIEAKQLMRYVFHKNREVAFHTSEGGNFRIEIRAMRAQRNYQEFIDLAKIFNARIHYLHYAYLDNFVAPSLIPVSRGISNLSGLKSYVTEGGLTFSPFQYLYFRAYNVCNLFLSPVKWLRQTDFIKNILDGV